MIKLDNFRDFFRLVKEWYFLHEQKRLGEFKYVINMYEWSSFQTTVPNNCLRESGYMDCSCNNTGSDQTVLIHKLISIFGVCRLCYEIHITLNIFHYHIDSKSR